MGDEFHAVIKLITGEEIFAIVSVDENDGDPIIVLQNPLIMQMFHNAQGSHVKVKNWIELSDEDFFMITSDKIITMTETRDQKLIAIYENFISEDEKIEIHTPNGQVQPSTKMGYISSIKDARKKLEADYNITTDLKEN